MMKYEIVDFSNFGDKKLSECVRKSLYVCCHLQLHLHHVSVWQNVKVASIRK